MTNTDQSNVPGSFALNPACTTRIDINRRRRNNNNREAHRAASALREVRTVENPTEEEAADDAEGEGDEGRKGTDADREVCREVGTVDLGRH